PEDAVVMYSQDSFEAEVQRRLGAEDGNRSREARRTRRSFLSEAYAVELDKQGRILVPPQIRDRSNLGGKVLIIGCGDYLELWHPDRWAGEQAELERATAEDGA